MKKKNVIIWTAILFTAQCVLLSSCRKEFVKDQLSNEQKLNSLLAQSKGELYYWAGNEKIYFTQDTNLLLIEIEGNSDVFKSAENIQASRTEEDNITQIILQNMDKTSFQQRVERRNIKASYPSIRTAATGGQAFITDRISIKFKGKADTRDLSLFAKKFHLKYIKQTPYEAHIFKSIDATKTCQIANFIHENEAVEWSSPDFIQLIERSSDLYPDQYYLNNNGQAGGTWNIDINAPEAWDITLGSNIRVAVVDDGIDPHAEFNGRLLNGFTAGSNNTLGAPLNHQSKGHGVACAGIIAATHADNDGIRGIAPHALLLPVNIFPNPPTQGNSAGAVAASEIATALNWAWRSDLGKADILSNSWGGGAPSNDIINQITEARTKGRNGLGSIVVFASGNGNPSTSGVAFPASVNGVITVGAIDKNGNIWGYSQRGPEMDVVAPSGNTNLTGDIVTTDRSGSWGYSSGDYTSNFGGTSAACPQVAGVAALMLFINPNLTESQVRSHLQNTATDMGTSGFDNTFGYGRLNAAAALQAIVPTISGANSFCANSTYTVSGLPTGTSVSWSVSPSYATITASSNTSVTLSQNPNWSGNIELIGQVTQGSYSYRIKKAIKLGLDMNLIGFGLSSPLAPKSTMFNYDGVGYFNPGTQYFEIESLDGKKISPMPYGYNSSQNNSSIVQGAGFRLGDSYQSHSSIYIRARFYNGSACGWSNWKYMTVNF